MNLLKKLFFIGIVFLIGQSVQAQIIEMSSFDGKKCRQELLTRQTDDQIPLILIYDSESLDPEETIVKNFEAVAQRYPEHAFFKFDLNSSTKKSFQQCLGLITDDYAVGDVIERVIRIKNEAGKINITNPVAAISGTTITQEKIIKFIEDETKNSKQPMLLH